MTSLWTWGKTHVNSTIGSANLLGGGPSSDFMGFPNMAFPAGCCLRCLFILIGLVYLIKSYFIVLPYFWHGSTSKTCFVHFCTMLVQLIATHQRFRAVCIHSNCGGACERRKSRLWSSRTARTILRWCFMSDLAVAAPWRGHVHAAEREISHAGGLPCRVPIDYLKIIYYYESWVVPAGVPSALADIGGRVEANYWLSQRKGGGGVVW